MAMNCPLFPKQAFLLSNSVSRPFDEFDLHVLVQRDEIRIVSRNAHEKDIDIRILTQHMVEVHIIDPAC
jgi:hypothetical protein